MPEDIPAVEDIKFARKRLEELAVTEAQEPNSLVEKLAEKFQEKADLPHNNAESQASIQIWEYKLPESVAILEQLARIIKGYP